MEIFGIGPLEFLFIFIIAIIVLGPNGIVEAARETGKFIRKIIRSPIWRDVVDTSREIREFPRKIAQEAGIEKDLEELRRSTRGPMKDIDQFQIPSIQQIKKDEQNSNDLEPPEVGAEEGMVEPEEKKKIKETDDAVMSFWEHVEELRKRLLLALVALGLGTAASFLYTEQVIYLLAVPVGSIEALQSIEVTENLSVFMRVSLLCGLAVSMPIILYELLVFVLPGLKHDERRWVYLTIFFGTILFLAGAAFAYYVMLPASVTFLLEFLSVETKPRLSSYINFITNLIFWMGVAFQFPILVFALTKLNIVSARALGKGWRYSLVAISVLAAMITPTIDPVNMALLMAPLFLLYLLSVLVATIATSKQKKVNENFKEKTN